MRNLRKLLVVSLALFLLVLTVAVLEKSGAYAAISDTDMEVKRIVVTIPCIDAGETPNDVFERFIFEPDIENSIESVEMRWKRADGTFVGNTEAFKPSDGIYTLEYTITLKSGYTARNLSYSTVNVFHKVGSASGGWSNGANVSQDSSGRYILTSIFDLNYERDAKYPLTKINIDGFDKPVSGSNIPGTINVTGEIDGNIVDAIKDTALEWFDVTDDPAGTSIALPAVFEAGRTYRAELDINIKNDYKAVSISTNGDWIYPVMNADNLDDSTWFLGDGLKMCAISKDMLCEDDSVVLDFTYLNAVTLDLNNAESPLVAALGSLVDTTKARSFWTFDDSALSQGSLGDKISVSYDADKNEATLRLNIPEPTDGAVVKNVTYNGKNVRIKYGYEIVSIYQPMVNNVNLKLTDGMIPKIKGEEGSIFTATAADESKYYVYLETWISKEDGKSFTSSAFFNNAAHTNGGETLLTKFEAGKTYTYSVWIKPKEGYCFVDYPQLVLNGGYDGMYNYDPSRDGDNDEAGVVFNPIEITVEVQIAEDVENDDDDANAPADDIVSPKTGDNLMTYVILLVLAVLGSGMAVVNNRVLRRTDTYR